MAWNLEPAGLRQVPKTPVGMSFTPETDIKIPFEPLPAAAVQATDHDEIDSPSPVHIPPDGGLHAWLKVLGGFLIYSNIW
jgi:hypothetical protein